MTDIMQRVTGGLYEDAKIDEKLRLVIKKNGAFTDITQIDATDLPLVRMAVRVGIATRLCNCLLYTSNRASIHDTVDSHEDREDHDERQQEENLSRQ